MHNDFLDLCSNMFSSTEFKYCYIWYALNILKSNWVNYIREVQQPFKRMNFVLLSSTFKEVYKILFQERVGNGFFKEANLI